MSCKTSVRATSATTLIVVICTLWTSGVTAQEISARALKQGGYELTLTNTSPLDERAARALIAQAAASICGSLTPVFGKYKFESREPLGTGATPREGATFRFVQQVFCDGVSSPGRAPPQSTTISPEEERHVRDEIREATDRYFHLLDKGDIEQAYALVDKTVIGEDKATWLAERRSFRTAAGRLKSISIVKVTVYNNPPEAPTPGLYVAADFQNAYQSAPYECGYLMWFRTAAGTFSITRVESGFVSSEGLKGIPEGQRPELLKKLRCVAP
jgi:Protein of unknown function (DUF4019)